MPSTIKIPIDNRAALESILAALVVKGLVFEAVAQGNVLTITLTGGF